MEVNRETISGLGPFRQIVVLCPRQTSLCACPKVPVVEGRIISFWRPTEGRCRRANDDFRITSFKLCFDIALSLSFPPPPLPSSLSLLLYPFIRWYAQMPKSRIALK